MLESNVNVFAFSFQRLEDADSLQAYLKPQESFKMSSSCRMVNVWATVDLPSGALNHVKARESYSLSLCKFSPFDFHKH